MRRLLTVTLLLLSTGLAACSSAPEAARDDSGAVASEGSVDALSVKLGDCFKEPIAPPEGINEVAEVVVVPCSSPHQGEVIAGFDLPDGDYPGDDAVGTAGNERCTSEFATLIGTPFEESALDVSTYQPTESSWEELDDREVLCVVRDPAGPTTGTLKGSAR